MCGKVYDKSFISYSRIPHFKHFFEMIVTNLDIPKGCYDLLVRDVRICLSDNKKKYFIWYMRALGGCLGRTF